MSLRPSTPRSDSTAEGRAGEGAAERDDRLVARIAEGDHEAFEALYERYHHRVFGYLLRTLGRPGTAEEVLDDVMLAVWQGAGRFDGRSRVSTWIFGIAYHKALKALERRRRTGEREAEETERDPDLESGPDGAGPERDALRGELRRKLRRAMEALSPVQRAAVELTFYYGYSYPEVAEIVGCPVGTVKTRMFHARRVLKERLPELGLRGDEELA